MTKIEIDGAVLESHDERGVTISLKGIKPMYLKFAGETMVCDPDTGDERSMTNDEERDLENAMDEFASLQLARQLRKHIRWSR